MSQFIKTIEEMLTQRGYKIILKDGDKIIGENKTKKICAFIKPVLKYNIERIKETINLLNKIKIKHCIIIYIESATPVVKKLINNSAEIEIELFMKDELEYNITKHILVPTHKGMSKKEIIEFKKKHSNLKLPGLLKNDPISRFYNFKRGDIIKIFRPGGFISYRIVRGL